MWSLVAHSHSAPARRLRWIDATLPMIGVWTWLGTGVVFAQAVANPQAAPQQADPVAELWQRTTLLGDAGGLRTVLGNYGISVGLLDTNEVIGNVSGGVKRGATYDGMTEMSLGLDTAKAFGWEGGIFNISALQIHGRNFGQYYLDNLQNPSGIAANPATRLWEMWFQQTLLGGKADIKIGQISADQEFIVSQGSGLFLNATAGWPSLPTNDMPSAGPAYPLSALGIRLRAEPTETLSVLAAVLNGNPAGSGTGDPQQRNASGTLFPLNNGVLVMAEIQYSLNPPPAGDAAPDAALGATADANPQGGLPGIYKLGFWYNSEVFPDQELATNGVSLANPASSGVPLSHRGNYSVYIVADQMLWRPDAQSPRSINAFIRAMGAPSDQNLASFTANGGLTLKAPLPGQDNDIAGLSFGYTQVSSRVAAFDRQAAFYGTPTLVRGGETFIEATYQWQVSKWWVVQPDFQYFFNPGGGLLNPNNPTKRIGDAAVYGLRSTITF